MAEDKKKIIFSVKKPENPFLASIVDQYFFVEASAQELSFQPEYVLPFPRITFGFFFDCPFLVKNHTLRQTTEANMVISKISTQQISVLPLREQVKIIGAHVRPFCLPYFTKKKIGSLPWIIPTDELFPKEALLFRERALGCKNAEELFALTENIFLQTLLFREILPIKKAVELIENCAGETDVASLSAQLHISDRHLRQQFYDFIGCSPKEFIRLVKLKQAVFQMRNSADSLTQIAYESNFFDQSHFIHEVKNITGISPKNLRKKMSDFRFLQF
jgi:AraC-like DNA-binding protein